MIVKEFAPAKINLALHVLGRRADGYHDLDSVVAFATVGDVLELSLASETSLRVDGPFAAGVPVNSENLVLNAHAALAQEFDVPPVDFRLTKNLPVASGVGGGSADAAAALRGIVKLTDLKVDPKQLQSIALTLGADVPVCLHGKACRMQGVGEVISSLDHLPAKAILLVNPRKPCGTGDVFRNMGLKVGQSFGTALDVSDPHAWRNDMTAAAIAVLPEIAVVMKAIQNLAPTATVRMSGSGATCFALFDDLNAATVFGSQLASQHSDWWIAPAQLC
jgi:4-diphosphocytidyl-2-C-methyl-D-erythritol kinase